MLGPSADPGRTVAAALASKLFTASRSLFALEHYRVPCEVTDELASEGIDQLRARIDGPALLWPSSVDATPSAGALLADGKQQGVPFFGRVMPDEVAKLLLSKRQGTWEPARPIGGVDDRSLGSVWQSTDGSVFLPFDPDEVVLNYLTERYRSIGAGSGGGLRRRAMTGYYMMRPLLPRATQIWLRRRFARIQARARFPRWPFESALHDFLDFILEMAAALAGEPVPYISPWPHGHSWALVLTHDVEQAEGYEAIEPIIDLERRHGFRSSWNFVPRRYEVDIERVHELAAAGFEVGVHGLYHDGRDLESLATLQERLPGIRDAADRWGAVGFRAPSTLRNWELMPVLGFDYDTSYPDTDPYEPLAGGCCSWLPFFIDELVELPLTLPQDHTLFVILRHRDETVWIEKAELLRERAGMALMDTHPDYLVNEEIRQAYGGFLQHFAQDPSAWRALPHEVSGWWRRRAASRLVRQGEGWEIVGPAAAEGTLGFAKGSQ